MSVKPEDILALANSLLETDGECSYRSSASRAYYATFHMIKAATTICPDNSHFVIDTGTHGKLIDRFKNWNTSNVEHKKIGKQIAYILTDMKRTREIADYEIDSVFLKSQAEIRPEQFYSLQKLTNSIWDYSKDESSS
jgi:uncharacterized protein (UPF0332 family)